MLVKVIDHKDKERFINAAFIKSLTPKNGTLTEIEISGWATKLKVKQPAEDVARIVNASLPNSLDALLDAEQQEQSETESAVLIAVIG